jgi:hypothetical protein
MVVVSALVAACTSRTPKQEESAGLPSMTPPDSLVLRLADSAELWYTGSMLDTSATGETCYERTVEIRRGETRTPVPLLYTLGEVVVMNDTSVRADLMRDCVKVDTYLINTTTGQPRRVP